MVVVVVVVGDVVGDVVVLEMDREEQQMYIHQSLKLIGTARGALEKCAASRDSTSKRTESDKRPPKKAKKTATATA